MNLLRKMNNKYITGFIGVTLVILIAVVFVLTGRIFTNQAADALHAKVQFAGQVKTADGEWKPYVKGEHISATQGTVTAKGNFELLTPDGSEIIGKPEAGVQIMFYLNHLYAEIYEDGSFVKPFDIELPAAGEDMCGILYLCYGCTDAEEVVLVFENPHKFGNENAIDDFFENLSIYSGITFEKNEMNRGASQRTLGIIFVLVAFMILGTAIFSMLIHANVSKNFWYVGLTVLFAGIYIMFDTSGVMYWSENVMFNTRMHGVSILLYMFSVMALTNSYVKGKTKKTGNILLTFMGCIDALFCIIPIVSDVKFFDLLSVWALIQSIVCFITASLLVYNFATAEKGEEIIYGFGLLPLIAFPIDVLGTFFGWWEGGFVSVIVFVIIFLVALVLLLRIIPKNINATIETKNLEAEKKVLQAKLAESRIAIMISQIQPHFIYNTLGTIEQLCISEPKLAAELVHNFSMYLRGNFSELSNPAPIRFSQEMNHVKHYTDIEQVRFPDMTIEYDLHSVEFFLPALSVQPLVENAIKHGLMGLEQGGVVKISAFETDSHYVVEVKDDGVGFDVNAGYDEKKHIGISNIRGRIEKMCAGTLTVESSPGKGTCATIKIPKESTDDSDNS